MHYFYNISKDILHPVSKMLLVIEKVKKKVKIIIFAFEAAALGWGRQT